MLILVKLMFSNIFYKVKANPSPRIGFLIKIIQILQFVFFLLQLWKEGGDLGGAQHISIWS